MFLKSKFKLKKIGHAGTLDPLAEGVLPVAIGEATKSIPYLAEAKKNYLFEATWGEETNYTRFEREITIQCHLKYSYQKRNIDKVLSIYLLDRLIKSLPNIQQKKLMEKRCL